jgi:hypothetical protein
LLQNIGRVLRGYEGRRVGIILLNCPPDFLQTVATSKAVVEGSVRPPVVKTAANLPVAIRELATWLKEDGKGGYVNADWEELSDRMKEKRRTDLRSREQVLDRIRACKKAGMPLKKMLRSVHPERVLEPEEMKKVREYYQASTS